MLSCSVGIAAYNEEANLGPLLAACLQQRLESVRLEEVLVVASGCTDRTEEIAADWARREGRVRLIAQERREGKARAVNLLLREARCDLLVLESADTLPAPDALEHLVQPFRDPTVGMVAARIVPLNAPDTFMGFRAALFYELQHEISQVHPRCGELLAVRRVIDGLEDTASDDTWMEALILRQGYRLHYAPQALVYNRAPGTVGDFLKRRRSHILGLIQVRQRWGYAPRTMDNRAVARLLWKKVRAEGKPLLWTLGTVLLEGYARALGLYDWHVRKPQAHIWEVAASTKVVRKEA